MSSAQKQCTRNISCFQLYTMPGSSGEDSSSDLDETPSKTLPEKSKTDSASAKAKSGTKLWGNHRFSNSQITRHANAGPPPRYATRAQTAQF